ncbi:hypothetical protein F5X96DRAFT_656692 [Biscogniauxia mediterranea]|nr:hypothetical protein F5X96DRAFT_656692 [Biscogniauxia mediterranea]
MFLAFRGILYIHLPTSYIIIILIRPSSDSYFEPLHLGWDEVEKPLPPFSPLSPFFFSSFSLHLAAYRIGRYFNSQTRYLSPLVDHGEKVERKQETEEKVKYIKKYLLNLGRINK